MKCGDLVKENSYFEQTDAFSASHQHSVQLVYAEGRISILHLCQNMPTTQRYRRLFRHQDMSQNSISIHQTSCMSTKYRGDPREVTDTDILYVIIIIKKLQKLVVFKEYIYIFCGRIGNQMGARQTKNKFSYMFRNAFNVPRLEER